MYCKKCGWDVKDGTTAYCPNCGAKLRDDGSDENVSPKSRLVAALLCWFFGVIGIHRFYVGRTASGIFMIFTIGGIGIWAFIDLIVILCGSFKDNDGRVVRDWRLDN